MQAPGGGVPQCPMAGDATDNVNMIVDAVLLCDRHAHAHYRTSQDAVLEPDVDARRSFVYSPLRDVTAYVRCTACAG